MNVWLCPIKTRSWQIIRKQEVFGLPRHAYKIMKQVDLGDFLVFYVLRPVNGIVAIYKVISELFEENRDIWGKDRYPLRVKIEEVRNFVTEGRDPVSLSHVFGGNSGNNIVVEPFLKSVWITKIEKKQSEKLLKLLDTRSKE